jgi:single-strand DNA-binding protein
VAAYNHVVLVGNLTSDIELRRVPSGVAVADLRLAVSEKFKNKNGELVDKAVFVDVVVWDKQAENCAQYLGKGSSVLVSGRLQMDEWTSKEGEKRSKLRIRADQVQFLGAPRRGTGAGGANEPASKQQPREDSVEQLPPDNEGEETPF